MSASYSDLLFQSDDRRFGMKLSRAIIKRLLSHCAAAGALETGGILLGHYSEVRDLAVVKRVCGPPPDSVSGRTYFHRGIKGLQRLLDRLWLQKEYYLGEWHFHPHASPTPSGTDAAQLEAFSKDVTLKCPEPILLIIGGDPNGRWQVSASVFSRQGAAVHLREISSPPEIERQ